ncbi:MAG: hypothetical protein IT353_06210 [Gemmatimonadaceae bacterium]|nr:hypothetical protein [Gemmatimonadaceae bacterium]
MSHYQRIAADRVTCAHQSRASFPCGEMAMRGTLLSLRAAFVIVVAAGCHIGSTGPDDAHRVTGRFGGGVSDMQVTRTSMYFQVRCDTFDGKRPVPDADGRFVLDLVPRAGNESRHATLQARISGDSISGSVVIEFPSFVRTDTFAIVRGARPNYQVLSCHMP